MKCSTINPFPFLGMAFQNLKSRLGCNWVYDTYGYLILRHMGFGLHGLVIVLQKLPWIGTCCLLWWSAQGHGQFSMRSCIASITNVAKCQNPAGSWWSLGGIWSTWLPFFNPAIAFPPRLCKYDNELCINLILIIVLQFYMSFMHWFTPVWGVSFVAADFQPLRFRHLLRGSRADAGGRGESWSQIPRSRCPCITIYYD